MIDNTDEDLLMAKW